MDIGNIINAVVAAATRASESSRANATATPDDNGGWTIQAGGVTETIAQGGRVAIGDTVFRGEEDGSLVVEQEGEAVRYARPEQETPPETTTTTTTTVPANEDAAETITIRIGMPDAAATGGTVPDPEDAAVTGGTVPDPEDAAVTGGTVPDPEDAAVTGGTVPDPEDAAAAGGTVPDPEDARITGGTVPDPEDQK